MDLGLDRRKLQPVVDAQRYLLRRDHGEDRPRIALPHPVDGDLDDISEQELALLALLILRQRVAGPPRVEHHDAAVDLGWAGTPGRVVVLQLDDAPGVPPFVALDP